MAPKVAMVAIVMLLQQLLSSTPVAAMSVVSEGMSQRDTATTLYAASTFFKCTSDVLVTVTSTAEVSSVIKQHAANNGTPVKIRATRPGMHSAAAFVCPGKASSTKLEFDDANKDATTTDASTTTAISLLLHRLNRVVDVDTTRHQLTVEAGMTLQNLLDAAEAHNMSVVAGALSIYANLTVGGVISASAHGSASSISELVRELKWVNARGEVIVSGVDTEEGAALLGGLGLLGVITEVTLQLEPWSRTVVEVRDDLDDGDIVAELERIVEHETPYVICYWRPDLGTYRVFLFTPVRDGDGDGDGDGDAGVPALDVNARNAVMDGIDDATAGAISDLHAAWGSDVADDSDSSDVLNAAACGVAEAVSRSPAILDGNGQPTKHATLTTNRAALTPECAPNCFFEPHHTGITVPAAEFAIKLSHLSSWVHDVKTLIRSELADIQARLPGHGKVCLPGPFLFRFGHGTPSLLSTNTGNDDVAYVQWLPMSSARTPRKPGKHAFLWETIEQLSLCKYQGRPSYGQNHERIFRHPRCHVRDNFPVEQFEKMARLQDVHDPGRVFEPTLFGHVLNRTGPEYDDLCALQHWCFCEEDKHCAERHVCVASPVFPEYKVCKVGVPSSVDQRHDEL